MKPSATVKALKRALDIGVGLAGTTAFVIAYPFIALLIKLESPGPALYLQSRVGLDKRSNLGCRGDSRRTNDVGGKPFTIRKFRSMRIDAEANGPQLCAKGGVDPRVTRFGAFLRASHLDELPQFWNVLKGEMSFIGPRPERPHFTVRYFREIPQYRERTRLVKPGITGLSQIVLGYDDTLDSVRRKTHYDLVYRASMANTATWLKMEFWVLFNTVRYLLNRGPLTESVRMPAVAAVPAMPAALGRPRLAMVRHRGTLKPTLVLAKMRSETSRVEVSHAETARVETPTAPPIANFFTVDVECWFHAHNLRVPRSTWEGSRTRVVDNVARILDLLAAHRAKGTFFVLGWVADRFPEVVRMIDAAGHEIGTHGYWHDKVTDMTPYVFEKDLDMSLNAIARATGQKVIGHRASNFSVVNSTLWALDVMAKYGIEYDSSIFPVKRKRYGIPEYPNRMPHRIDLGNGRTIQEIPLSVAEVGGKAMPISGGGYLRLYPYAVTDLYIRGQNRKGQSAMLYLHPWEIDVDQERVSAGLMESFQHYVNLDTTEWKIDRLLERFSFNSVRDNLASENVKAMLAQEPVQLYRPVPVPASEPVPAPTLAGSILPVLSDSNGLIAA